MSSYKLLKYISVMLLCFHTVKSSEARLEVGFYDSSCDLAESIVKQEVSDGFLSNPLVAAGVVRLHFLDCFVRGWDGSVLLDSTPSHKKTEKDAPPNKPSLRAKAFQVIDNAKTVLEDVCPGVVSCADIVAFAARDSIELTGGLKYDVPAGRRDGRVSSASEALSNLPSPAFNLDQLTQLFADKCLNQDDMVTLSGAHTLGGSHCSSFSNRLYNFSSILSQDPTLNPLYAAQLKALCPEGSEDASVVVPMDPTPTLTDIEYYRFVTVNRGLFTSDQSILTSQQTLAQVVRYGNTPFLWRNKFAAAMVKMGTIGVLTGNAGEIRANCRKINV